jgi:hypothetical protein
MSERGPAEGELFAAVALPVPAARRGAGLIQDFTAVDLVTLRHAVRANARDAGLSGEPLDDSSWRSMSC